MINMGKKARNSPFLRAVIVLVCSYPACHAAPDEPETNCDLWIPPPVGAIGGFPIGLGKRVLCSDSTPSPTPCPNKEDCFESCIKLDTSIRRCWCDPGCKVYGDCCYNSTQDACYIPEDPFPPGEIAGAEVTPERRVSEECVRTWIFELLEGAIPSVPDYRGHWLVANCPADYAVTEVIQRCESEQHPLRGNKYNENETLAVAHYLPVTGLSGGAHYKNMYCALCNGVELSDIAPWNIIKYTCKTEEYDPSTGTLVEEDCSEFAYRFYPPSQRNDTNVTLPAHPRRCIPGVIIEECPAIDSGNNSVTPGVRSWAADLCRSYQALLQDKELWFKNPHCAACHGVFPAFPEQTCYKPNAKPASATAPLSVPFDFFSFATDALDSVKSNYECPDGFHFSTSAQKCVPKSVPKPPTTPAKPCPDGFYFSTRAQKCVPDSVPKPPTTPAKPYNRASCAVEVDITISTETNGALNDSWVQTIASMFMESLSLEPSAIIDVEKQYTNLEPTASQNNLEQVLSFTISNISHAWGPERFSNISDELLLFTEAVSSQFLSTEVLSVRLAVPCTGNSSDECNSTVFDAAEVEVLIVNGITYLLPKDDQSSVLYQVENIFQRLYIMENNTSGILGASQQFLTCNVTKDLTCYHITLQQPSQYAFENGVVQFNIQGLRYESMKFLKMPDESVKICKKDFQVLKPAFSLPLFIINVVGTSLSSLALIVTFVTYATFSSLRTVPGKATMHFVVALFLAEILTLIPDALPDHSPPGVCHFIAVIAHFVWLACFFWMTALGFDVSRTFSMRTGPKLVDKSGRSLLWMILFSWGTPTVILVICIPLHFVYSTPSPGQIVFTYGRGNVCWIQPALANLLAFGLPVLACLLVNSALFVKTFLGLRASKRITSFIEKDKTAMQRASEEFFIYLKVSILMGLTWIWIIISSATGEEAIEYIAVVFNSCNGCFVFVAFVCNRRVWNMWQRKLYGKQGADSSKSGTVSTGKSRGATMTKSSALSAYSESSLVEGSPVPGKMGLNGTRL